MTVFPMIEGYRRELRAMTFARLDAAGREGLQRSYEISHHSNAIEGVHPTPEAAALLRMFVEEGVPTAVSDPFVLRYLRERTRAAEPAQVA